MPAPASLTVEPVTIPKVWSARNVTPTISTAPAVELPTVTVPVAPPDALTRASRSASESWNEPVPVPRPMVVPPVNGDKVMPPPASCTPEKLPATRLSAVTARLPVAPRSIAWLLPSKVPVCVLNAKLSPVRVDVVSSSIADVSVSVFPPVTRISTVSADAAAVSTVPSDRSAAELI